MSESLLEKAPAGRRTRRFGMIMALEPRLMFDGAAASDVKTVAASDSSSHSDSVSGTDPSANSSSVPAATATTDTPAAKPVEVRAADPTKDSGKKEVVFIESDATDYKTLVASVRPGVEVVVLDSTGDGLSQIADWAKSHSGYDTMSIVSHGNEAQISLGSLTLTGTTAAARSADLATVGSALTADGDLLIYSCDLAEGRSGKALIQQLANETSADVAASTDDTGAAAKGGNWVLEATVGDVTATAPFDAAEIGAYTGILSDATFGFGDSDSGTMNVNESAGGSVTTTSNLTETIGSSTLYLVSTLADNTIGGLWWGTAAYLTNSSGDVNCSIDTSRWAGSWGTVDYETVKTLTLTLDDGKHFDLNSLNFLAVDAAGNNGALITICITNNSGYTQKFTVTNYTATSLALDTHFNDVSSVAITCLDTSNNSTSYSFLIDNIAMTNIYKPGEATVTAISNDSGTAGDFITNTTSQTVSGTYVGTLGANQVIQVSIDGGSNWSQATTGTGTWSLSGVTLTGSSGTILVRTYDTGTTEFVTGSGHAYVLDTTAPTASVTAASIKNSAGVTTAQSTELGTVYLVNSGSGTSFTSAQLASLGSTVMASASVTTINTGTSIDTSHLTDGTYYLYAVDAAGNVSVHSTNAVVVDSTAPVVTNGSGNGTYMEKAPATVVDAGATVTEAGSAGGSTLVVALSAGGSSDELSFSTTVSGSGVYASGTSLYDNGSVVGTITSSSVTGTTSMTVTFAGSATASTIQDVVSALRYRSTSDDPASSRTVCFTLTDGAGNAASAVTRDIAITAVNDAPTASGTAASSPSYYMSGSAVPLFTAFTASAVESAQAVATVVLTVTGASDNASEYLSVDGQQISLAAGSGSTTNLTYVVTGSAGAYSIALTEKTTSVNWSTIVTGITYGDSATSSITRGDRVVTVHTIQDNGGTSNGGTDTTTVDLSSTVTVRTYDTAPTLSATGTNPTYTENQNAVTLFSGVTAGLGGADTGQTISSIKLTVDHVSDGASEILTIDGTDVVVGTDGGSGTTTHGYHYAVALTGGVATVSVTSLGLGTSDFASLVGAITYKNTSDNPTAASTRGVTITEMVDSGSNSGSNHNTATLSLASAVTIVAVNDPPTSVSLDNSDVSTYDGLGATVGTLSATDPDDTSWQFAITQVRANGGPQISDPDEIAQYFTVGTGALTGTTTLKTSSTDQLAAGTYSVSVRATDHLGGVYEHTFTVTVSNALVVTTNAHESYTTGETYATATGGAGLSLWEAVGLAEANGGGTIRFASSVSTIDVSSETVAITSDITLDASNNSALSITGGTISIASGKTLTLTDTASESVTISGTVTGSGSLAKAGDGTLVLSHANTYAGGTSVTGGTVEISSGSALGSGIATLDGAVLKLDSGITVTNDISLGSNGATVEIDSSTSVLSGTLAGTTGLTKAGAGTLVLSGTNSGSSWSLDIDAGTVRAAGSTNLSSGHVTVGDTAALSLTSTGTIANALTLGGAASIDVGTGATVTLSHGVDGTGAALHKTGAGTLTLGASNSFTGGLAIEGGSVTLGVADALTSSSAVTMSTGTGLTLGANATIASLSRSSADATTGVHLGSYTLTLGNGTSPTFGGAFDGSGTIAYQGTGALTLSGGSSSFTGTLDVRSGTVVLAGSGVFGSSATLAVDNGATLQLSTNQTAGAVSGAGTLALGSNTFTVATNLNFSGALTGTAGSCVILQHGGTLTGSNSGFLGSLEVAGTLAIDGDGNLGTGSITLDSGATLSVASATTIDEAIFLGGNATITNADALTLSGAISGAGHSLTKTGIGALTLSHNDTIGTLNVSAGSLALSGVTLTGNLSIGNAGGTALATMSGTGTVTGTLLIGMGSTLAPGVAGVSYGIGQLQVGALELDGTLQVQIAGDSSYDSIAVGGTLTSGSAANVAVSLVGGYDRLQTVGRTYVIISGVNSTTARLGGAANADGSTYVTDDHNAGFTLGYPVNGSTENITLTGIAIPQVGGVDAVNDSGTYVTGNTLTIWVTLDRAVTVSSGATMSLALNDGATASYSGISADGKTLYFTYAVASGQNVARLDSASATALTIAAGTVRDQATGVNAWLTLPAPGSADSLSDNKSLRIDTTQSNLSDTTSLNLSQQTGAAATGGNYSDSGTRTGAETGRAITLAALGGPSGDSGSAGVITLSRLGGSAVVDTGRIVTLASVAGTGGLGSTGGGTGLSGSGLLGSALTGSGAFGGGIGFESPLTASGLVLSPILSSPGDNGYRTAVMAPGHSSVETIVVARPVGTVDANGNVNFSLPSDAFAVSDPADHVSLSATLANGQPLPGWLNFNPATGRFEGTPPPGVARTLDVKVVARDAQGHAAYQIIHIDIAPAAGRRADLGDEGSSFDGRLGLSSQLAAARQGTNPHMAQLARALRGNPVKASQA